MARRVYPASHGGSITSTNSFVSRLVKDTEKINQILEFAKSIGVNAETFESPSNPQTIIVIEIDYKREITNTKLEEKKWKEKI